MVPTERDDPRVLLAIPRNLLHPAILLGPLARNRPREEGRVRRLDLVDRERVVVRRDGDVAAIHLLRPRGSAQNGRRTEGADDGGAGLPGVEPPWDLVPARGSVPARS